MATQNSVLNALTNGTSSIALAGNVTFSGAFTQTFTVTGNTSVTLPTSGTLYGTATGSITSSQLLASMSDETGTGSLVFATSPVFTTPNIGTATGNITGNAATVTTNANLTGDVTSTGNATAIAAGVIVNADVNASAAIALTKLAATTVSRALVSDGSGFVTAATTTATEIGYVNGVTSAIQTQIDSKVSLTPRVTSVTSSSTPTPNAGTDDEYILTALAVGATFAAPTGSPVQGQAMFIRIKDNGGAQTLAFNAIYRAIGVTLPTTTVAGKTLYIGMIYNFTDTRWDVLSTGQET